MRPLLNMEIEITSLARHLHLPLHTLERWIRQGRIPVRLSGSQCVFKKEALEQWAEKYDISFSLQDDQLQDDQKDESGLADETSLLSVVKRGGIISGLEGSTVEEVLKNAVACVPDLSESEKDLLFTKLMEREKLTSTGIGKGVAIPHPRNPLHGGKNAMILTCFLKNKIDFKALDNKPVSVLFVVVCPSVKSHLSILSQISFCLRDDSFIDLLNGSPDHDEFFKTIAAYQERLDKVK